MFNFPPGYVIFLCQSTNLTLINLIYYGPSPGLAACIHPQVSKKINHSLEKYKSDQGEGSKKSLIRQLCLPHTRGTPHLWPGQRHLYGQLCLFIPMTIQATPSSSTSHFSPPPISSLLASLSTAQRFIYTPIEIDRSRATLLESIVRWLAN